MPQDRRVLHHLTSEVTTAYVLVEGLNSRRRRMEAIFKDVCIPLNLFKSRHAQSDVDQRPSGRNESLAASGTANPLWTVQAKGHSRLPEARASLPAALWELCMAFVFPVSPTWPEE